MNAIYATSEALPANLLQIFGILLAILTATALMFLGVALLSAFISGFTDHYESPNEGLFQDDIDLKQ